MDELIFQVENHAGTRVALTRKVWEDKILSPTPIGHPEVEPYLEAVRQAIMEPDVVFQSTRRQDTRLFYRLRVGVGRYEGLHIVIVVKYRLEPDGWCGYVSTAYLTRKLYSRGRVIWTRTGLLTI